MSEYESVQQNMGDAMASQPPSEPHFGADPRVLAQMPDLNASEPEVTNTPSRRRRRSPDSMRSGPTASPKVVIGAILAVAAAITVVVALLPSDDSGEEQASEATLWDSHESDGPEISTGEFPSDSEMLDQGSPFGEQYAGQDQYGSQQQYGGQDLYGSQEQYGGQNQYGSQEQYGSQDQYGSQGQYAPAGQYVDTNTYPPVDQRQPPSQYDGSRVGSIYENPSNATSTWGNQPSAGFPHQEPAAEAAATGGYYGDGYQTARPAERYQDSTTYGAANQRPQSNPYAHQQPVPYTQPRTPGAAVTIAPPEASLRDGRQLYTSERFNSSAYNDTSRAVPEVAQRPIYPSDTRSSSIGSSYRSETAPASGYQRYEPSYRESTPSTSYRGTSTPAPRYEETSTNRYSSQPGVATTDGTVDRQPSARDSYDSYRPNRY